MQQPRPGGGAFGVLDTWSHSIEEQGQKTLHGHYIVGPGMVHSVTWFAVR